MIRFLHRHEIDDERWKNLILASEYETVYAHTWYLDACAKQWGALVLSDYEYLMPVAYNKKYGINYVFQPRFCQQLGVYSGKEVDLDITGKFLHALKKRFGLGDYAFNEGNQLIGGNGFELSDNTNYTLQLSASHDNLKREYSANCRRNLQKALQGDHVFSDDISIEDLVQLKRQHDHRKQSDGHYKRLVKMFSGLKEAGRIKACGVKKGKDLHAGAVFAYCDRRVHYLLSVSSREGREKGGMFLVIDRLIQENAGRDMHLDFEGSNIPSIARFFKGFGAKPHIYQRVSINNAAGRLVQKLRNVKAE